MRDSVAGNVAGNVADNVADYVADYVRSTEADNAKSNVTDKARSNVADNARSNVADNARSNVTDNAKSNVADNAKSNVADNARSNVADNARSNVADILCIMPVYNNDAVLKEMIVDIKSRYQNIFIIDDFSMDGSSAIIRDAWALPICRHIPGDGVFALYHEEHKGLKRTLLEAIEMATSAGFSDVVFANPAKYQCKENNRAVRLDNNWLKRMNFKQTNWQSLFFKLFVTSKCGF